MKKWIANLAVRIAKTSKFEPYKHACVVVNGGTLLSIGINTKKPNNPQTSCSIHAEKAAVSKMAKKGSDAYVARVSKQQQIGLSKPCPKCMKVLKETGIKNVYFSISDKEWGHIRIN